MKRHERLPDAYLAMEFDELNQRIGARRSELGSRLCILGHHYQRDEIISHADCVGDSLKLSQRAAGQREAEYIVFCGVHFMAESAAILCSPKQTVILPNMRAGCPMADMARAADVHTAIEEITSLSGDKVLPVTYVNSSAEVKAITGALGGSCCTSSNALDVFRWALDPCGGGAKKILMIPDEHLGRNTAAALGYGDDACATYDPSLLDGGLQEKDLARATFLLWKGHCYVHQQFTTEQVIAARKRYQDVVVMIHPECTRQVAALADLIGSTEQIIRAVSDAKPASHWVIGTETHLVRRLAKRHADRSIICLSRGNPVCIQMQQINLPHLLWALDVLANDGPANVVTVPEAFARKARIALRRMLDILPPTQYAHAD
ncbi:MAG: quinolinate synthetase [Planctomycetes bacterium RBG_13_63_9]|nr:MAG: quinolinate synthetase [Planctomycetes bacterium RBG_13_63_9]